MACCCAAQRTQLGELAQDGRGVRLAAQSLGESFSGAQPHPLRFGRMSAACKNKPKRLVERSGQDAIGGFENTNPMGRFAALRSEPSLAVADGLVKTKPNADSSALTQNAIGQV